MKNTFSFRAEYIGDLVSVMIACMRQDLTLEIQIYPFLVGKEKHPIDDRIVEMKTTLSLETIHSILDSIIDTHVIKDTIRQCSLVEFLGLDNTVNKDEWPWVRFSSVPE